MTFLVPATADVFILNTGDATSDDSLWLAHCARWHPYWLEKKRLAVDSVALENDGQVVEFASGTEAFAVVEDQQAISRAMTENLTVYLQFLDLANSTLKSAIFGVFPRLRRLNVSFTPIIAVDLARNGDIEILHACECQSLRSVKLPAVSRIQELCITGARFSELDLEASALLTHLNLCGSQFGLLRLPAYLNSSSDGLNKTKQLESVTLVDISGPLCQALPLTYLINLYYLGVSRSDVRELDVPGDALECLDVSFTYVSALPRLPRLRGLYCEGAPLYSFDLADFPALEEANLSSTSLETIELTGGKCLQVLKLAYTLLFELDFSRFEGELRELDIAESEIGSLDCARLGKLRYLDIFKCGIARLDTQHLPALEVLLARESALFYCDFANLYALRQCDVSSTQLMQIDLSSCSKLESLNACGTAIAEIDCACTPKLYDLRANEGCVIANWAGKRGD